MFLMFLFGSLLNSLVIGTYSYEECLKSEFKPKACWSSEQLNKGGKLGCGLSEKKLVGEKSECK